MAAGFVSRRALAAELNRRGTPTARGGRWHYTTVVRVLRRLGLLTSGVGARIHNGQAGQRGADEQAKALASTIREIQARGLDSLGAMARELNARDIRTARGSKWQPTSVRRLLQRLEMLDRFSRDQHRR